MVAGREGDRFVALARESLETVARNFVTAA